jgi:hypothetical protein
LLPSYGEEQLIAALTQRLTVETTDAWDRIRLSDSLEETRHRST